MSTLILLRHGESSWNQKELFTGWVDVDLTPLGVEQATAAGALLVEAGLLPDVVHTSLLTRAIRTSALTLAEAGRSWIPVQRSWRLNERHYGALQGQHKNETLREFGAEQYMRWRRSYATPPPPIAAGSEWDVAGDPRYAGLPPDAMPRTECLADVVVRLLPYWCDVIAPDLLRGSVTLVTAHGNSLRALVKHLDGISDAEITDLNIPTGIPLVYELDADLRPTIPHGRYLDPAAAASAAAAVANQGQG